MKIGIAGGGSIVREFLSADIACAEAAAVYTRRAEAARALADEFGIATVCESYAELLAADVDFIYIAVPNDLHFEFAEKALKGGKNVILEKPFTVTLAQARALAGLAVSKGLYLFEAISNLYTDAAAGMADGVGRIGKIKSADLCFMQRSKRYDDFKNGIIHPVFDVNKSGGVLMDLGIYCIHLLNLLFGAPKDCEYRAVIERGVDVDGIIRFLYDDFEAVCRISKTENGENGIYIKGESGFVKSISKPNEAADAVVGTDGKTAEYSGERGAKRLGAEWAAFEQIFRTGDYSAMKHQLGLTLTAMELLEKCRAMI